MTPEQLKASILQYAIQGKLVEQRPEEGTGEELYQQIQAEKQRLIKEKKIKKEKTLAEITEGEIPFDIPDSWKWVKLGDCTGYAQTKEKVSPKDITGDMWSLDLEDVQKDTGAILVKTKASERKISGDKVKFHKGQVLYSKLRPYLKKILVAPDGGICTPELVPFDTYLIDENYIAYVLRSPHIDYVINSVTYGVKMPRVGTDTMTNLLIPLPPIAEQKRIVAKIEELLPYVDCYAAAYEKLEQFNAKFPEDMKKSILQYAIQGKLVEQRPEEETGKELYRQIQAEKQRLIKTGKLKKTRALPTITGEEFPYDFPASWKVCYIDDIAFVTKLAGFEYTKYISDNLVPTGIPLFKGKNVQNGKLVLSFESYIPESVSDELPRSQITKKCLLTPYVGTIGNIAVFDGSFKAHLGSNVGKIELLNSDTQTFILEEYVLWYLKSTYGYAELTKYKKATAQESISIDAIRNVVIAIPPLEEQRRIVAKLEEILPLCERLK